MNDNEDAPSKRKELWAVAFLAILGGNFTGLLNTVSPTIRSDPMTGTEARAADSILSAELHRIDKIQGRMELRMDQRESASMKLIDLLQNHLDNHQAHK